MIINNFIPKNNEDLIEKTKNNFFKGTFYLNEGIIYWQYNNFKVLSIVLFNQPNESYIEYYVNGWSHEHIPVNEIFEVLVKLNNMEFLIAKRKRLFGKETSYLQIVEKKGMFTNIIDFQPYKYLNKLNFSDNEKKVNNLLGAIKKQYKNYGGGKTVIYNDYNNLHIYFDNNGLLYGMHLFNSLTFKINNIFYIIDFNEFQKEDLLKISDDFIVTAKEEGFDYTSKKLGIDFYFNDDNQLEAVLFMSHEYFNNEFKY